MRDAHGRIQTTRAIPASHPDVGRGGHTARAASRLQTVPVPSSAGGSSPTPTGLAFAPAVRGSRQTPQRRSPSLRTDARRGVVRPRLQTGLAPARGVREASSKYPRVGRHRFPIQSDRRRRWPYRSLTKVGEMECGVRSVRGTSWPYDAIRWAMWKEAGNRQWPYCPTRWAFEWDAA